MNDSECTCDIRLGGCTCGAMERERRGAAEPVKPADPRCWFCPAASVGAINGIYFCELHRIEVKSDDEPLPLIVGVKGKDKPGLDVEYPFNGPATLPTPEEIDAGNRIAGMRQAAEERRVFAALNAAAVNANVSPDVVRERAERVYGPEFLIVTKQQAAKMEKEHAELVARIEALEERDAARTTARGFILHPGGSIGEACLFISKQVRRNLDRGQSVKIVILPAD